MCILSHNHDSGDVLGLIHNGTAYYYLKNQQGDVLKIAFCLQIATSEIHGRLLSKFPKLFPFFP